MPTPPRYPSRFDKYERLQGNGSQRCSVCYLPKVTDAFDHLMPMAICYGCKRDVQKVIGWLESFGVTINPPTPQKSPERAETVEDGVQVG